jgi:hypothetical protein
MWHSINILFEISKAWFLIIPICILYLFWIRLSLHTAYARAIGVSLILNPIISFIAIGMSVFLSFIMEFISIHIYSMLDLDCITFFNSTILSMSILVISVGYGIIKYYTAISFTGFLGNKFKYILVLESIVLLLMIIFQLNHRHYF